MTKEHQFSLVLVVESNLSETEINNTISKVKNEAYFFGATHVCYLNPINRIIVTFDVENNYISSLNRLSTIENIKNVLILDPISNKTRHLSLPTVERNYLISPPPSPPVGWESLEEKAPSLFDAAAAVGEISEMLREELCKTRKVCELVAAKGTNPAIILSQEISEE
ncbi:hypothetical protein HZS_4530, partial [Henneguya salminicola]